MRLSETRSLSVLWSPIVWLIRIGSVSNVIRTITDVKATYRFLTIKLISLSSVSMRKLKSINDTEVNSFLCVQLASSVKE
jgi:hypothetical protein